MAQARVSFAAPEDGSDAKLPAELPAGAAEGLVRGYEPEAHCYRVRPLNESGELGDEIGIPVACCQLPVGCKAVVVGLQGGASSRRLLARAPYYTAPPRRPFAPPSLVPVHIFPRGRPRPRGCSPRARFCLRVLTDRIFPTRVCPAPEHNGKSAHITGMVAESGRYEAALSATQTLRLKRANLRV